MANQAVKIWEVVLRSLPGLDGTPCSLEGLAAVRQPASLKIHVLVDSFRQNGNVQKGTWKKLVCEMKVPKRLAKLCCSDHNQLSPRLYSAIFSLGVFFSLVSKTDWYLGQQSSNRPASNLAKSLAEQLQQSGFVQQLPMLLSTAADELAAVQNEQEMLASTQVSAGLHDPFLEVPSVALLQHYVMHLLGCFVQLLALRCKLSPHIMHSAQRLVCAADQHACRCLELLPDQTAPSYQYMSVLACTKGAAFFLLQRLGEAGKAGLSQPPSSRPNMVECDEQQHMYISRELMTCSCSLLLLALCKQHRRPQLKQRSDDIQDRSSSIWQFACAQHSRLPQPYLQLCQALGYSSRAFLYVACSTSMTYSRAELDELIMDLEHLLQACHGMLYAEQGSQIPKGPEQQQLDEGGTAAWVVLSHLAAVALLHSAADRRMTPEKLPTVVKAVHLTRGLLACSRVQQAREDSVRSQLPQQQQQQQPGLTATQPQSSACGSDNAVSEGCQQDTMQWWLTGELLEQALELISTFVQKFWVLLTGREAAAAAAGIVPAATATAAAALSSGGSSSSSSSSSSVPCGPDAPDGNFNTTLWVVFSVVLELQRHAQELHAAELRTLAGSSTQDTQQHTSSSKAWAKHWLLLTRLVEALCRVAVSDPEMMSITLPTLLFPLGAFLPASGASGLLGKLCPAPFKEPAGLQLFSLSCSFLKALAVSRSSAAISQHEDGAPLSMMLCTIHHAVTSTAKVSAVPKELAGGPAAGGTCSDSSIGTDSSTDSSTDNKCPSSPDSSSGSNKAVSVLPWLVLLGRCCLHWALELQQSTALRERLQLGSHLLLATELKRVLEACLVWLQDDSTAAELTAAGYDTRRVVAALQEMTVPARTEDRSAAGSDGSQSAPAAMSDTDDTTVAQQLHALGLALNTLAISCACNNPHCCNLEGLSELDLVQGRARLCAKCRVARYCSKPCQAQHWKLHKPACKALEAACCGQDGL